MSSPVIWFGTAVKFLKSAFTLPGTTSGAITITAPSAVTSYTNTLPAAQGASGTVQQNDGSGNMAWVQMTAQTRTINAQTGTTYTLALADGSAAGGNPLVTLSNASAITATVPPNSSVAFPIGTQIDCMQIGAGKVTFAQGAGVTINSQGSNKSIAAQWVAVSLIKTATDTWTLIGSLIA